MCANDFYSRAAMHKNERMGFLMHRNKWTKIVQAFSMVWCFYFIPKFYSVKYEANDCENTSFVHSETRTIILHTVNPSLYENKTLITSWVAISTTRSALAVSKHGFAIDSNGKNRGFKSPMSQSLEKKFAGGREGSKESVTILTIRN